MNRPRREALWAVAIALAVKAIVLLQLGSHPLLQPQGDLDTARYVELGRQVAAGGPLAIHEAFYLSPLYVYFLAAVFKVGGSLGTARIVQICLGSVGVGFVYLLAREWFGRRVAVLASALAVLAGFITFSEILILQSALDPFLVAAVLYAVSRTQTTSARGPLVATGIALGLFALNRPNALAYGLAAASLIGLAARRVRSAAIVLVSLAAVLGLNMARNYLASGEAVLISSHGGLNFYIGNNPDADGIYHPLPGVAASMAGQVRDATRVAESSEGRRLSPAEVSGYFYTKAFEWMVARPGDAARLFARKLALLVNRTDVPLNYSYAFYKRDESTILRWLFVGPMLLVPLGMVGLFLGPHALRYWTWASFVPIYAVSVAAFFVSDRYRLPLFIPLTVFAARTLVRFADAARHRQIVPGFLPLGAALAIATLVAWNMGLDDGLGGERARKAGWLIERGSSEDARRYAATAGDDLKYPGVFHFKVGEAFTRAALYDDAARELRTARAIDRGQPAIELALGQALLLGGRSGEAVAPLRAAVDGQFRLEVSGPWLTRSLAAAGKRDEAIVVLQGLPDEVISAAGLETQLEIGTLALELNAPAPAERWLRPATASAPESSEAQEKLGVAVLLQGRAGEAVLPLEHACRLAPARASARLNLAVAYAQLGRLEEARAAAREAARLDPAEPRARALVERLSRGRP